MRVAALYDIHANLPALEAVLEEVRQAGVDQIVVGGDVVPGPMPRETLRCLADLDLPVQFIHGNGELAMLAQMAAKDESLVTYWGTTGGGALPEKYREGYRWTVRQLYPEYEALLSSWPKVLRIDIDGLGPTLFCHGTPRSETELFTRLTSEEKLLPLFEGLDVSVIVCGHTHMQFDRMIGTTRVVNTGSVSEPYGEPGAYWLVLGPDVQLRRTTYNVTEAAELMLATQYPQAQESAEGILHPRSESEMLELFGKYELK